MLQVTPQMRILVCIQPVDFRKGIDGMAAICRNRLRADPHEGTLFLFRSCAMKAIRLLTYDGQGFWICTKRLSQGRFQWWPESTADAAAINSWDLHALLGNGNPSLAQFGEDWRRVCPATS